MAKTLGLIADIGGTNARFALADAEGYRDELVLKIEDYQGPVEAVEAYLSRVNPSVRPDRAAFAVAGPVKGDRFEAVNLPWKFSCRDAAQTLKFSRLDLFNDFQAIAMAVPHLKPQDLRQIGEGAPQPQSPIGVIGPGTGLGVASLFWNGQRYQAVPGEGGHVTMSAVTQREFDIFRTLHYKYRHVSAERVCSGKGLVNIYNAIRILEGRGDELPERTAEEISTLAVEKKCEVCEECLDLMIGFLGHAAGNLALTLGAHGGIYIAGGIVKKLGEYFYTSRFRKEFLAKGRLREYLGSIPTFVIQHPYPAFVGLQATLAQDAG